MGDLRVLLNEITSGRNDMESCEDFQQVQIILDGVNQYVHPLDRIVYDSGNEPYILEVVARLLRYLRLRRYLNAQNKVEKRFEPQLRRITMYLLLNTDASFRYDLMQDARVNQVLNTMPQITKCLMINCIWGLDLDQFFYEMLRYAPSWFSLQFLDQAIVSLKYGKPNEVLTRIESMVCAIYFAVYRTDVDWKTKKRSEYVNHQRTLDRLQNTVEGMLRFVNAPEEFKFRGWSKVQRYRYFGHVLKHMFTMTMACLDLYFRKPAVPIEPAMAIYQLMDDVHVHKPAPDELSEAGFAWLMKINHCMLNTLEACIKHVSLECFVYWSEIDLSVEGQEPTTMQEEIANFSYRLCEELNSHTEFRHSVVRHLTQFAKRPRTLAERASLLTLGGLMRRIDNVISTADRLVYLNEFISRGEQVFDNEECIGTIDEHWSLLTVDNLHQMIAFDQNVPMPIHPEPDGDDSDAPEARTQLRSTILRAVRALQTAEFNQLVEKVIITQGKHFGWYDKHKQLADVIELANRLQNPNLGELRRALSSNAAGKLQDLIFQSPEQFFQTLINSLYSFRKLDYLVDAIVDIIARYMTISRYYMMDHLKQLLVTRRDECHSTSLLRFAQRLFEVNLYPPDVFVDEFLLEGLNQAYLDSDHRSMNALLELMERIWPAYSAPPLIPVAGDVQRQGVFQQMVKRLALIPSRLRHPYPPANMDSFKGGPDRMMVVWKAIKLMLPTLDQLIQELPDGALIIYMRELAILTDTFTAHYFLNRLESDFVPPAPFLTQSYLSSIAEIPPDDKSDEAIATHLVRYLTMCTWEEVKQLAKTEAFRSYLLAVNVSEIKARFALYQPTDWTVHCATNYVACLVTAVLPGGGASACDKVVSKVVELLEGFSPECVALQTETTKLIEYVKRVAPTVDLKQLISFVTAGERRPAQAPMQMEENDASNEVIELSDESSQCSSTHTHF